MISNFEHLINKCSLNEESTLLQVVEKAIEGNSDEFINTDNPGLIGLLYLPGNQPLK